MCPLKDVHTRVSSGIYSDGEAEEQRDSVGCISKEHYTIKRKMISVNKKSINKKLKGRNF